MAVINGNQKSTGELDGLLNAGGGGEHPIYNIARARARAKNEKSGESTYPLAKVESQNKDTGSPHSITEKQNSQQSRKNSKEPIITARWVEFNGKKLLYVKVDFDNEIYVRQISVDEPASDQQNGKKGTVKSQVCSQEQKTETVAASAKTENREIASRNSKNGNCHHMDKNGKIGAAIRNGNLINGHKKLLKEIGKL